MAKQTDNWFQAHRPGNIAHTLGAATLSSFGEGFDTDGKIASVADKGGTRQFT